MRFSGWTILKALICCAGLIGATTLPAAAQKGLDEPFQAAFKKALAGKTVADLLDQDKAILPAVDANATVMEIANIMAATRNSLVAVSSDPEGTDAPLLGVITVSQLLDHLLPHD